MFLTHVLFPQETYIGLFFPYGEMAFLKPWKCVIWWGGMGWDVMGWMDGVSKVSFNFLYTSWVYRSCIYLLIYVIKFCHQHSYGFQNLISSWRVWIWFLKLLRGNVFLKNHNKSKVFQNTPTDTPLLNFFEQNFDILSKFVWRDFFCKIDPPSLFWGKFRAQQKFRLKGFLL